MRFGTASVPRYEVALHCDGLDRARTRAGDNVMSGSTKDRSNQVAIKVIVELRAQPGKRAELLGLMEAIVSNHGGAQPGFLGSTRYEVVDDPDTLVEIAEWESAEARTSHMEEAAAAGTYAPLAQLLATPFRATVISQLP